MKPRIIIVGLLLALLLPLMAWAEKTDFSYQEIKELNEDLDAFLAAARAPYPDVERLYISKQAVHNIYRQKAIWRNVHDQDVPLNEQMANSLVKFVFVQYYLNNPDWADWGLLNLETFYPAYSAYLDTSADLTYGECLSFVKNNWLTGFARCHAFNELVKPALLEQNPLSLVVRRGIFSDEDKYVIDCATEFINHWMNEHKEWFTFFLPAGEYQITDKQGTVFPKEFNASIDSAQFVYFTPNFSFDFIPVAQVFTDTGVYYDTLSPSEFELIRINEGRLAVFDSLEFGRYLFQVKPPYQIVDKYPAKLIIPKDAFGADYMDRESTMFNKQAYDKVTVGNKQKLIYTKIELVKKTGLADLEVQKK